MNFTFQSKTKTFMGSKCIFNNKNEFLKLGKKALIVTGKSSGLKSGALIDVKKILSDNGIVYEIFDSIENNPSIENINDGKTIVKIFSPNFIIGIGGGSPLDAAKAIAVLATNDIEPIDLFDNVFLNKPLPVVAIPTTAGTGSEVTQYVILTRHDLKNKKSFGNEFTFPVIAFLDYNYTKSLNSELTIFTAMDAFSHSVEGYLGNRSTVICDFIALEAMKIFGECLQSLQNAVFNDVIREKLLYMSYLAGLVIIHTGTTSVHSIGYSLTYFKNIQHGQANGILLPEYLKINYEYATEKINKILVATGICSLDNFSTIIGKLLPTNVSLSKEEIELYASIAVEQRSISVNPRPLNKEDIKLILSKSLND